MDTALAILLYLSVITAPGTYSMSQIENFETVYSQPISDIIHNLPQLEAVLAEFEPEVPEIYIPTDVGN